LEQDWSPTAMTEIPPNGFGLCMTSINLWFIKLNILKPTMKISSRKISFTAPISFRRACKVPDVKGLYCRLWLAGIFNPE
jgi:hypothetical protein